MKLCELNLRHWGQAVCALALGCLFTTSEAAADKAPAPRRAEPAKTVLPVEVKYADLGGEGDGVKARLVLPARLHAAAEGKKVGATETIGPRNRSVVAAVAMAMAAVSIVFVLRGKQLSNGAKGTIVGIGLLVGACGIALANVPPPPSAFVPKPGPARSTIVIEFSGEGEGAVLTIAK